MTQYAGADAVPGGPVIPGGAAGGDLAGTYPDPTVAKVPAAAVVAGTRITVTTTAGKAKLTGAAVTGLPITAETSATGVALINGTQTILTVTVPNDGKVHQFIVTFAEDITAAVTGGQIGYTWTSPNGAETFTAAPTAVGYVAYSSTTRSPNSLAMPGTVVTFRQSTAMTAGAAKVYAKIVVI